MAKKFSEQQVKAYVDLYLWLKNEMGKREWQNFVNYTIDKNIYREIVKTYRSFVEEFRNASEGFVDSLTISSSNDISNVGIYTIANRLQKNIKKFPTNKNFKLKKNEKNFDFIKEKTRLVKNLEVEASVVHEKNDADIRARLNILDSFTKSELLRKNKKDAKKLGLMGSEVSKHWKNAAIVLGVTTAIFSASALYNGIQLANANENISQLQNANNQLTKDKQVLEQKFKDLEAKYNSLIKAPDHQSLVDYINLRQELDRLMLKVLADGSISSEDVVEVKSITEKINNIDAQIAVSNPDLGNFISSLLNTTDKLNTLISTLNAQINKLNNNISVLENDQTNNNTLIETLRGQVSALETAKQSVINEFNEYKVSHSTSNEDVERIRGEYESQIATKAAEISELNAKIADLEAKLKNSKTLEEYNDLLKERDDAISERDTFQNDFKDLSAAFDQYKTETNAKIGTLENAISEKSNTILELQNQIGTLNEQLKNAKTKEEYNKLLEDYNNALGELSKLDTDYANLMDEFDAYKNTASGRIKELENAVLAKDATIEELRGIIAVHEARIAELEKIVEAFEKLGETSGITKEQYQAALDAKAIEEENRKKAEKALEDEKAAHEGTRAELATVKANLETLNTRITELTNANSAQEAIIAELRNTIAVHEKTIGDMQAIIDDYDKGASNLVSKEQYNAAVAARDAAIAAKAAAEAELASEIADHNATKGELATAQGNLNSANARIASLESELTTKAQEIQALKTQMSNTISRNEFNTLKANYDKKVEEYNTLYGQYQAAIAAKQKVEEALAKEQTAHNATKGELATTQASLKTAFETIDELESNINNLSLQLATYKASHNYTDDEFFELYAAFESLTYRYYEVVEKLEKVQTPEEIQKALAELAEFKSLADSVYYQFYGNSLTCTPEQLAEIFAQFGFSVELNAGDSSNNVYPPERDQPER